MDKVDGRRLDGKCPKSDGVNVQGCLMESVDIRRTICRNSSHNMRNFPQILVACSASICYFESCIGMTTGVT
jgi:hypothetical protein